MKTNERELHLEFHMHSWSVLCPINPASKENTICTATICQLKMLWWVNWFTKMASKYFQNIYVKCRTMISINLKCWMWKFAKPATFISSFTRNSAALFVRTHTVTVVLTSTIYIRFTGSQSNWFSSIQLSTFISELEFLVYVALQFSYFKIIHYLPTW